MLEPFRNRNFLIFSVSNLGFQDGFNMLAWTLPAPQVLCLAGNGRGLGGAWISLNQCYTSKRITHDTINMLDWSQCVSSQFNILDFLPLQWNIALWFIMSFGYLHPKNGMFPVRMDYEKGIQYHVFMLSHGFSVARSPILLKMLTDRSCWWQGLVLGHWMVPSHWRSGKLALAGEKQHDFTFSNSN